MCSEYQGGEGVNCGFGSTSPEGWTRTGATDMAVVGRKLSSAVADSWSSVYFRPLVRKCS